jgi:hypothetical protein
LASAVAERGVRKVLTDLEAALARGQIVGRLAQWRAILVPLIEKCRNPAAFHRLLDVLVILEAYPDPIPPRERESLSFLVRGCLAALERRTLADEAPPETKSLPEALAASHAFAELQFELSRTPARQPAQSAHKPRQLFAPDA